MASAELLLSQHPAPHLLLAWHQLDSTSLAAAGAPVVPADLLQELFQTTSTSSSGRSSAVGSRVANKLLPLVHGSTLMGDTELLLQPQPQQLQLPLLLTLASEGRVQQLAKMVAKCMAACLGSLEPPEHQLQMFQQLGMENPQQQQQEAIRPEQMLVALSTFLMLSKWGWSWELVPMLSLLPQGFWFRAFAAKQTQVQQQQQEEGERVEMSNAWDEVGGTGMMGVGKAPWKGTQRKAEEQQGVVGLRGSAWNVGKGPWNSKNKQQQQQDEEEEEKGVPRTRGHLVPIVTLAVQYWWSLRQQVSAVEPADQQERLQSQTSLRLKDGGDGSSKLPSWLRVGSQEETQQRGANGGLLGVGRVLIGSKAWVAAGLREFWMMVLNEEEGWNEVGPLMAACEAHWMPHQLQPAAQTVSDTAPDTGAALEGLRRSVQSKHWQQLLLESLLEAAREQLVVGGPDEGLPVGPKAGQVELLQEILNDGVVSAEQLPLVLNALLPGDLLRSWARLASCSAQQQQHQQQQAACDALGDSSAELQQQEGKGGRPFLSKLAQLSTSNSRLLESTTTSCSGYGSNSSTSCTTSSSGSSSYEELDQHVLLGQAMGSGKTLSHALASAKVWEEGSRLAELLVLLLEGLPSSEAKKLVCGISKVASAEVLAAACAALPAVGLYCNVQSSTAPGTRRSEQGWRVLMSWVMEAMEEQEGKEDGEAAAAAAGAVVIAIAGTPAEVAGQVPTAAVGAVGGERVPSPRGMAGAFELGLGEEVAAGSFLVVKRSGRVWLLQRVLALVNAAAENRHQHRLLELAAQAGAGRGGGGSLVRGWGGSGVETGVDGVGGTRVVHLLRLSALLGDEEDRRHHHRHLGFLGGTSAGDGMGDKHCGDEAALGAGRGSSVNAEEQQLKPLLRELYLRSGTVAGLSIIHELVGSRTAPHKLPVFSSRRTSAVVAAAAAGGDEESAAGCSKTQQQEEERELLALIKVASQWQEVARKALGVGVSGTDARESYEAVNRVAGADPAHVTRLCSDEQLLSCLNLLEEQLQVVEAKVDELLLARASSMNTNISSRRWRRWEGPGRGSGLEEAEAAAAEAWQISAAPASPGASSSSSGSNCVSVGAGVGQQLQSQEGGVAAALSAARAGKAAAVAALSAAMGVAKESFLGRQLVSVGPVAVAARVGEEVVTRASGPKVAVAAATVNGYDTEKSIATGEQRLRVPAELGFSAVSGAATGWGSPAGDSGSGDNGGIGRRSSGGTSAGRYGLKDLGEDYGAGVSGFASGAADRSFAAPLDAREIVRRSMDEAQAGLPGFGEGDWPMGNTLVSLDEDEEVAGYSVAAAEKRFGGTDYSRGLAPAVPAVYHDAEVTEGATDATSSPSSTAGTSRRSEVEVRGQARPASRNTGEVLEAKMGRWPLGWEGALLEGTPTGWGPLLGRLGWADPAATAADERVAPLQQQLGVQGEVEEEEEGTVVQQQLWQPPQQLWRQPGWKQQQVQQWEQLQDKLMPGYEEPFHLHLASPGAFGAQQQQQQVARGLQQHEEQAQEPFVIVLSSPGIGRAKPVVDGKAGAGGQVGPPRFAGIIEQRVRAKEAVPASPAGGSGQEQRVEERLEVSGRFGKLIRQRLQAHGTVTPQKQQPQGQLLKLSPNSEPSKEQQQTSRPEAASLRFAAVIEQRVQAKVVEPKQALKPRQAASRQPQQLKQQKEVDDGAARFEVILKQQSWELEMLDKQSAQAPVPGSQQQQPQQQEESAPPFAAIIQQRGQMQKLAAEETVQSDESPQNGLANGQSRFAAYMQDDDQAGAMLPIAQPIKQQQGDLEEIAPSSRFAALIQQRAQTKQVEVERSVAVKPSSNMQQVQHVKPQQKAQQQQQQQQQQQRQKQLQEAEVASTAPSHSPPIINQEGPMTSQEVQSGVLEPRLGRSAKPPAEQEEEQQTATQQAGSSLSRFGAIIQQRSQGALQQDQGVIDQQPPEEQNGPVLLSLPSPVFGAAFVKQEPAQQQHGDPANGSKVKPLGHARDDHVQVQIQQQPQQQEVQQEESGLKRLGSPELGSGGIAAMLASLKQQRQQLQGQSKHQPWERQQMEQPPNLPYLQPPQQQQQQPRHGVHQKGQELAQELRSQPEQLQQQAHHAEQQQQQGQMFLKLQQGGQQQQQPKLPLRPSSPLHHMFASQPPVVVLPHPYVGRLVRVEATSQALLAKEQHQKQQQPHSKQDQPQSHQNHQQQQQQPLQPQVQQQEVHVVDGGKKLQREWNQVLKQHSVEDVTAQLPELLQEQKYVEAQQNQLLEQQQEQHKQEAQMWQQQEQGQVLQQGQEQEEPTRGDQPGQQQEQQWQPLPGLQLREQAKQHPRSHALEMGLERQVQQQHLKHQQHEQQRQLQKQRLHDLQVAVQKQLQQQQQLEQALVRLALQASGRDEEEMATEALAADEDEGVGPQLQQQQEMDGLEEKGPKHLEQGKPKAELLIDGEEEEGQEGLNEENMELQPDRPQSPADHLSNLFGKLTALIMPIEKQRQQEQQQHQQQRVKLAEQEQQEQQLELSRSAKLQQAGLEEQSLTQIGAEVIFGQGAGVHDDMAVAQPPYTNRAFRLSPSADQSKVQPHPQQQLPLAVQPQQQQQQSPGQQIVLNVGTDLSGVPHLGHDGQKQQQQQQQWQGEQHRVQEVHSEAALTVDGDDAMVALPPYTSKQFRLSARAEAQPPQQQQQQQQQQQIEKQLDHGPYASLPAQTSAPSYSYSFRQQQHQQQHPSAGFEVCLNLLPQDEWVAEEEDEQEKEEQEEPQQPHEVCLNLPPAEEWVTEDEDGDDDDEEEEEEEEVAQAQLQWQRQQQEEEEEGEGEGEEEYEDEQHEVFELELPPPEQWEEIDGQKVATVILSASDTQRAIVSKPAQSMHQPQQQQQELSQAQQHHLGEQHRPHQQRQEQQLGGSQVTGTGDIPYLQFAELSARAVASEQLQPVSSSQPRPHQSELQKQQQQQQEQGYMPQRQIWLDLPPPDQWLSTAEQQQRQQQQHERKVQGLGIPASMIAKAIIPQPGPRLNPLQKQQQQLQQEGEQQGPQPHGESPLQHQAMQQQIFGGAAVHRSVQPQQGRDIGSSGGNSHIGDEEDGPFPVVLPPKKPTLSAEQLYKRIHTAGRLPDLLQVCCLGPSMSAELLLSGLHGAKFQPCCSFLAHLNGQKLPCAQEVLDDDRHIH